VLLAVVADVIGLKSSSSSSRSSGSEQAGFHLVSQGHLYVVFLKPTNQLCAAQCYPLYTPGVADIDAWLLKNIFEQLRC
jgi:hypothetical protein